MKRAWLCLVVGLALGLWLPAPRAAAEGSISIVDVSTAFSPGPYTALRVDPLNPRLIAVGTQEGFVSWSDNAGRWGHDTTVARSRNYVFLGFRPDDRSWTTNRLASQSMTNALNTSPLSSPSWAETAASVATAAYAPNSAGANGPLSSSNFGTASNASQFASDDMPAGDRLFMSTMNSGKAVLRWQRWMSIDDTQAPIFDVAFSGPSGKLAAATPMGIYVSDRQRGAWLQSVGFPHPRRSTIQEYDPDGAGVQGTAVAIDPTNPEHMLAGTSAGLMVSTNGGETFFAHLDPKLADDPILHFLWGADNPDRVIALTSRSVLLSKDRGKTFAAVLSTSADLNALGVGPNATYGATHEGLIQVGFDGKIKKFLKDESVVGVIPLSADLVLVATENVLEVLRTDGEEPIVLKRAHPADPFLALQGTPELSYALTKNGVFRVSVATPNEHKTHRLPQLRLSLTETEARVFKAQRLVGPWEASFAGSSTAAPIGRLYYFLPWLTVQVFSTTGSPTTLTQSGLLPTLPYSQASGTGFTNTGFYIEATFGNLPNVLLGRIPNPLNMKMMNLRPIKEDLLNQVRWHYRACEELISGLRRHPPSDDVEELSIRLRIQEFSAYLEAMAGEPVVLIDEED